MPSTKRRINLTVPEDVYERIQDYERRNGISNDAGACLQLVVQQLNAQDNSRALMKTLIALSSEEAVTMTDEGVKALRAWVNSDDLKSQ